MLVAGASPQYGLSMRRLAALCVCVTGLLACNKKTSDTPTRANGGTKASSSVADFPGSDRVDKKGAATAQHLLKLDCSELGPDVAVVDEQPGPGVPRIVSAGAHELPPGWIAYES